MLDLASLAIFAQVAANGSITRTAQLLGRAQSNVTTRIQQLEEQVGTALFVREARRMVLTPEGQRLLHYADQLLSLAEEAEQSLRTDSASGQLRLGSNESTAAARLPQPLAQFHRSHPAVQLTLSTGPTRQLVEQLLAHQLDVALVSWPPPDLDEPLALDCTPLFEEPLRLLLPAGTDADSSAANAPTTLAAFTDGCTYRRIGEAWMQRQHGSAPTQVLQLHSYHAIIASVAAGSAAAVAPQSMLDLLREPPPVQVLDLPPCTTMFVTRSGYHTPAAQQLLSVLQASRAPVAR